MPLTQSSKVRNSPERRGLTHTLSFPLGISFPLPLTERNDEKQHRQQGKLVFAKTERHLSFTKAKYRYPLPLKTPLYTPYGRISKYCNLVAQVPLMLFRKKIKPLH